MIFQAQDKEFDLSHRVMLMGILNVTPDSFSEQGLNYRYGDAVDAGLKMLNDGADILDIGGESTRPGAEPVDAEEEISRVVPVIRELRGRCDAVISIDTWKAEVAEAAVAAGARLINDISACRRSPDMAAVVAETKAGYIAMHMRGTPQTMQQFTNYDDIILEINAYFSDTLAMLKAAGVASTAVSLDPGIGFSKSVEQNLTLIKHLGDFCVHGCPLFIGPSRKSFIGTVLEIDTPADRVWGTAAAVATGISNGARVVRVHDVREMRQVCKLAAAIEFSDKGM